MRKGKLYSLLFVLMGLACACLGFGLKNDGYAQAASGGVLYFSSGARGTISGIIDGGVVSEAGGGIYIGSGANVNLTSTGVIKNCSAGPGAPGGAVYLNGGTFNLSGTIQNCSDGGYGGAAVFMDGGSLSLLDAGKLVEFEGSYHSLFRIDGGFAQLFEGFSFDGCTGHSYLFYLDGGEMDLDNEGNFVGPFRASEKIYAKTLTSFPSGGIGTVKFSNGGGFTGKITSDYTYPFVVGIYGAPSSSAQYNFVNVPEGKEGYPIAYLDDRSWFNASNWNVEGYDVELGTYNGSSAVLLKSKGYTISFDLGLEYCSPYNMVDTYFQTGWGGTTRSGFPGDFSIEILDEDTIKLNGNSDGSEVWLSLCEVFIPYGTTFKASVNHVSGTVSGTNNYSGFEGYLITASSPEAHHIGMQGNWSDGYFMGITSDGEANTQTTMYRWAGIKFYDENGSVTFDDYVIDLEFKLFSDTNVEANGRTVELTNINLGDELPAITAPAQTWMDATKGYGTIVFQGYYTGKNGTGTRIYDESGAPIPSDSGFQSDTILYGYWTGIPIAEVRFYSDTLNFMLCGENPNNMNQSILQEYDICGYATRLTKFYTHKASSGANGYGANTGSFYAYVSVGAETSLGCPGQRDWKQGAIAFEDDYGTKTVVYEALEGDVGYYSSDRTVIQIDLVATAHPIRLYFSNGNSSGGTVSTSSVSTTYGAYAKVTAATGTLKIYNSSGTLISTKTPTLASGYSGGYWRVYVGTSTTGDYSLLHYNGNTATITNTAGYSFRFYPIKTSEKTVTITTTMSDLYVNGSIYSSSSPVYNVTSGGTITLQTKLPYIDNSVTISGPEGAYYRYYMWTIYVDGEEYYSYINKGLDYTDRVVITVSANMEIEVVKKTTLIIGAIKALPDFEYEDIEQDKELEIISCLYDDKRYWLDKKYLTTGATNHTSQEDLFQLEKYEIGSIEVQR